MALGKARPAASAAVGFGQRDFYAAGGAIVPEGDYALVFNVVNYTFKKNDGTVVGDPTLGVLVDCHPLDGGEMKQQFYGMGRKAGASYQPDPNTGKGLVAVPGGPGGALNDSTNWAIMLDSLYNSGLPEGIFDNDISVLDGVHVHLKHIAEPESRKGFKGSATGEAAMMQQGEDRGPKMIAVVSEIKEGGMPWEGGGGVPAEGAKPKGKVAGKIAPKVAVPAAKTVARPAAKAAPAQTDDDAILQAAAEAIGAVLEKAPGGVSILKLRMDALKALKAEDADVAEAVQEGVFGDEGVLGSVLGDLGYEVNGKQVVPAA
jgi:hypothetical protein